MTAISYTAPCPNGHKGAYWTDTLEQSGAPSHDFICQHCDPPPLVRVPAQRMAAAGTPLVRFLCAVNR